MWVVSALLLASLLEPQQVMQSRRPAAGGCSGEDFTADATLEAHWKLEDDGTWLDETANNNDLAEIGTVTVDGTNFAEGAGSADFTGSSGNRLEIDETNMDAGFPFSNSASTTADVTVVCRVRVETLASFSGIFYDTDSNDVITLYMDGSSQLAVRTNGTAVTWTSAISANTWYSIAGVWDSSRTTDELNITVNGVERASANRDSHAVCESAEDPCMSIGERVTSGLSLDGQVDECLVFSSALSAARLLDLHDNGADGCGLP